MFENREGHLQVPADHLNARPGRADARRGLPPLRRRRRLPAGGKPGGAGGPLRPWRCLMLPLGVLQGWNRRGGGSMWRQAAALCLLLRLLWAARADSNAWPVCTAPSLLSFPRAVCCPVPSPSCLLDLP